MRLSLSVSHPFSLSALDSDPGSFAAMEEEGSSSQPRLKGKEAMEEGSSKPRRKGKKCVECGQRGVLKRPKTGKVLCKSCFLEALEEEVHQTIVSNDLFRPGERVAIGASGGKVSCLCLSVFSVSLISASVCLSVSFGRFLSLSVFLSSFVCLSVRRSVISLSVSFFSFVSQSLSQSVSLPLSLSLPFTPFPSPQGLDRAGPPVDHPERAARVRSGPVPAVDRRGDQGVQGRLAGDCQGNISSSVQYESISPIESSLRAFFGELRDKFLRVSQKCGCLSPGCAPVALKLLAIDCSHSFLS